MEEYFNILVYLMISAIISIIIFVLSYVFVYQMADSEKASAYECGFSPFGDARSKFEIRFYLVAILFIVFDLEIMFLFPWTVVLETIGYYGIVTMLLFLIILTLGFVYEWFKGALDWE